MRLALRVLVAVLTLLLAPGCTSHTMSLPASCAPGDPSAPGLAEHQDAGGGLFSNDTPARPAKES